MSDKTTDRLVTDFKRVVDKVTLIYGEDGADLRESAWYLRTFDALTPMEQSNPNIVAKVRSSLLAVETAVRLIRGMGENDNFPPKFWDSEIGALIARAQYWLYRDKLVTRMEAHEIIFGNVEDLTTLRRQRVWLHSKCYPARNRQPKLHIYARSMLLKSEVEALREEVGTFEASEEHHRDFGGRRTKENYEE